MSGILVFGAILTGCNVSHHTEEEKATEISHKKTLNVVTTTGMIEDTVKKVGGENVKVMALVGPGVDPHLFKPTLKHIQAMEGADVIFYNGIELEARMGDALVSLARSGKKAFPVTEDIDTEKLREPEEFEGKYDPHFWHDIPLWIDSVKKVERELAALAPNHADKFSANAASYISELEALDKTIQERMAEIPEEARVLITAHDAFGYFGNRYGVEVRGVVGISTEDEASAKGIDDLANFIVERGVKAIFVESSASDDGIEALEAAVKAKGGEIKIGGELLADSLAAPGEEGDTYQSMMEYNMETIVGALK